MATLKEVLALVEARLAKAKHVAEMFKDDPDLAKKLLGAVLQAPVPGLETARVGAQEDAGQEKRVRLTHWARVRQFYETNSNKWHTVGDVARATGSPRGTVAHLFYSAHKDDVESRKHPRLKRQKLWRLRDVKKQAPETEGTASGA